MAGDKFVSVLRFITGSSEGRTRDASTLGADSGSETGDARLAGHGPGTNGSVDSIKIDRLAGRICLTEVDPGKRADVHARRLLAWCQAAGGMTGQVLAAELQAAYIEMTAELDWRALSWLRVGEALALITGPRVYRYFRHNGKTQRLRVYSIPREGMIVSTKDRVRQAGAQLIDRIALLERTTCELNERIAELTGLIRQSVGATPCVDVQGEANIKSEVEVTIKGLPEVIGS